MSQALPFESDLLDAIAQKGQQVQVPSGHVLLTDGAFVGAAPIVISGLVKVTRFEAARELLLYYIRPGESCVMSFTSIMEQAPSRVVATAEVDSEILLLPAEQLPHWHRTYPRLQRYFLDLYRQRYEGLIETIDQLAFQKLDERLLTYLHQKHQLTGQNPLSLTHQHIATDLGSTREVISRLLKKLEKEGAVKLSRHAIELM